MKQRGVGEHAIKMVIRQIEPEEILLPDFATAMGARHHGEMRGAFQTHRNVTEFGKHLEVAAGPAAKIQAVTAAVSAAGDDSPAEGMGLSNGLDRHDAHGV